MHEYGDCMTVYIVHEYRDYRGGTHTYKWAAFKIITAMIYLCEHLYTHTQQYTDTYLLRKHSWTIPESNVFLNVLEGSREQPNSN